MLRKTLLALSLFATTGAMSLENSSPVVNNLNGSTINGGGGPCEIENIQGPVASGFLSFAPGVATHAILVDPTGSGAAGDPGCGGNFNGMIFDVTDVAFFLGNQLAFGQPGDGLGVITYEVSIHPFAVPGDSTMGPGPAIATQTQVIDNTVATDPATTTFNVATAFPDTESITEPFFVAWRLISYTGTSNTISTLWDGVARPVGRQFIDNTGDGFVDQTDFFTNGTVGWVDVVVTGEFRSASADLSLNVTNNASGQLAIGDVVTFTQTLSNGGPGDASNAVVTSELSNGLDYTSNDCGATASGANIIWNVGSIANGASSVCNVVATVSGFGQLSLTASASADESDTVPGNNAGGSNVNGPIRVIPTLSIYGILLLMAGMFFVYRRKA